MTERFRVGHGCHDSAKPVGVGLLEKMVDQATFRVYVGPFSRAGSLPQGFGVSSLIGQGILLPLPRVQLGAGTLFARSTLALHVTLDRDCSTSCSCPRSGSPRSALLSRYGKNPHEERRKQAEVRRWSLDKTL